MITRCEIWLQESKLTVWDFFKKPVIISDGEKDVNQVPCVLCNQQLADGGGPISIVCSYSMKFG